MIEETHTRLGVDKYVKKKSSINQANEKTVILYMSQATECNIYSKKRYK